MLVNSPEKGRSIPRLIEEANNACFIVRDSTGQALGYFYFEDEPGRRSAAKLLTRDEARRHGGELRQAAGAAAPKWLRLQTVAHLFSATHDSIR